MYTAIDIFCGSGGVSQVLKRHFNVLAAVEYDEVIAKSYELNHGKKHLFVEDITKIDNKKWRNIVNVKTGSLDLLVSTPPCQGFSRHSRKKAGESKDKRNELINETLKLAYLFEPKYIFFENVNNIINYKIFHSLLRNLSNIKRDGTKRNPERPSYHIRFEEVIASDYNIPQKRKRLILIAKKIDSFSCKNAFVKFGKNSHPHIILPHSIWPEKKVAPNLGRYLKKYKLSELSAGQTDICDLLHTCSRLSDLNLERIRHTPHNGGSRNAWPDKYYLDCHKKEKVSFSDVYGRMDYNDYAPTITCGCICYTKGRFGHPVEDRAISLREAALIQTFPKSYKFTGDISGGLYAGSKGKIATQIGNAVPVKLAKAFIDEIVRDLSKNKGQA